MKKVLMILSVFLMVLLLVPVHNVYAEMVANSETVNLPGIKSTDGHSRPFTTVIKVAKDQTPTWRYWVLYSDKELTIEEITPRPSDGYLSWKIYPKVRDGNPVYYETRYSDDAGTTWQDSVLNNFFTSTTGSMMNINIYAQQSLYILPSTNYAITSSNGAILYNPMPDLEGAYIRIWDGDTVNANETTRTIEFKIPVKESNYVPYITVQDDTVQGPPLPFQPTTQPNYIKFSGVENGQLWMTGKFDYTFNTSIGGENNYALTVTNDYGQTVEGTGIINRFTPIPADPLTYPITDNQREWTTIEDATSTVNFYIPWEYGVNDDYIPKVRVNGGEWFEMIEGTVTIVDPVKNVTMKYPNYVFIPDQKVCKGSVNFTWQLWSSGNNELKVEFMDIWGNIQDHTVTTDYRTSLDQDGDGIIDPSPTDTITPDDIGNVINNAQEAFKNTSVFFVGFIAFLYSMISWLPPEVQALIISASFIIFGLMVKRAVF